MIAGEVQLGYELLFYLTKVPRFGVVSMFLGQSDKQGMWCYFIVLMYMAIPGVLSVLD